MRSFVLWEVCLAQRSHPTGSGAPPDQGELLPYPSTAISWDETALRLQGSWDGTQNRGRRPLT